MQLDLDRTIVAVSSPWAPAQRAIVRISGGQTGSLLVGVLRSESSRFVAGTAGSVIQTPHPSPLPRKAGREGTCIAIDHSSPHSGKAGREGTCIAMDHSRPHSDKAGREENYVDSMQPQGSDVEINQFLAATEPTYMLANFDLDWWDRRVQVGVYYWPSVRSFTGEPCAELHLVGSQPIVQRVLDRLHQLGAYPADRGEFALRSFLAGKLDLLQAEAVLGVIESVHGQQLQWALSQLGGNLSRAVQELRSEIVELLARLEAGLDFVDQDIQFITTAELLERIQKVSAQIAKLSKQLEARGGGNRQQELVLVGLPNAGKSSLFNALLGHGRSIVTAQAGTTRDAVAASLEIPGVLVTLVDTAGIEELNDDSPRSAAQGVLKQRIETADILLFCVDASDPPSPEWFSSQRVRLAAEHRLVWTIGTKADQLHVAAKSLSLEQLVSIDWPDSIESLRRDLQRLVEAHQHSKFTEATYHTAVRCRDSLQRAVMGLERATGLLQSGGGEELVAIELHAVLDDLASIIGQVYSDDILGEIFSRFCIGK